jgi:hypothetical protein
MTKQNNNNKTKLYVISSSKFSSLKDAKEQMTKWWKADCLDKNARVYEVSKVYTFKVITDLKQEKLE